MQIYFHHFHKCAGTSIVKSLETTTNGFFEPNLNGNPVKLGKTLSLHDMADTNLESLCKEFALKNKCFAYEWGIPNLDVVKKYNKLVVVIREPIERLISNYKYDIKIKASRDTFREYISNIAIPYCRTDYYNYEISRRLNNYNSSNRVVENASWILNTFDEVILLENGDFKKIKNGEIVDLENIPLSNSSKAKFEFLRKRPTIELDEKDFEDDSKFYSLIKGSGAGE